MRSVDRLADDADAVPVPDLEGRWVRLRTVRPDDAAWIYDFSTLPELGFRWRNLPGTTDPGQFAQHLSSGVQFQLLVEERTRRERAGLALCYNADFTNRTAYIAAAFHPRLQRRGWPLEAVDILVRYCFAAYDFRKLYAEVIDFNLESFRSAIGQHAHEEGVLRDHWWVGGAYRDVALLSLYREDCQVSVSERVRSAVRGALGGN